MNLTVAQPWPVGKSPADQFCGENERLAVLASYQPDHLEGDSELEKIVRFAAQLCKCPIGLVSMVEAERQRFLAREGLADTETPRSTSICAHTMLGSGIFEVLDASLDDRFADFALVRGDANIRYYAGAPLISSEGAPLGALCIIDTQAHSQPLDEFQREGLLVLAEAVKRRLESHRQASFAHSEMQASAARLQFVLDSMPDIAWSAAPGPVFDYFNARFESVTGHSPVRTVEDWRALIHPDDFEASAEKFGEAIDTASLFQDEWRLRVADGSYRWVLSRAVPSSDDPKTARWFGTLTDIDDAHRLLQERELLAGELAHRIKNIFSVVIGLVSLSARGKPEVEQFSAALSNNLRALSRAQEFALKVDDGAAGDLHSLLEVLMAPYSNGDQSNIAIAGDWVAVGRRAATPLALTFHELATNSAKYGALSVTEGRIAIGIVNQGDDTVVRWTETGGPATASPETTGFGSRLLNMAIAHQLGGRIEHDWRPDGLSAAITIPGSRLAE